MHINNSYFQRWDGEVTYIEQTADAFIRCRSKIINVTPQTITLTHLELLAQKRHDRCKRLRGRDLEPGLLQGRRVTKWMKMYSDYMASQSI
jgi:hypothetical protein